MGTSGPGEGKHRFDWLSGYRSALRRRDLRRLLIAELISLTGSWAYNVALLAFVFERTRSLAWVGAAGLVRFIPSLLLSAPGGVLAERRERIGLMVSSDLASAACQGALAAVAAASGPAALGLVFAGLTAATSVVYGPATAATIPSLVDEDDLAAANALNSSIEQLVVIAGPAVGAVLLFAASPAAVFAINAGSFLASAALVSRIRARTRPVDVTQGGQVGVMGQMLAGVRAIVEQPAARTLVAYCALVSFVYGTDTVLFVGVSEHRLGTASQGFGYLMAGLGLGGILMAAAVNRLAASRRLAGIILAGALAYTLPTALLVVIRSPALAVALEVVRGGATLVVDVLAVTALQRAVAPELLSRVFGVFFAFVLGAISLGAVLTPAVVSAGGLDAGLWTMALAPAAVAVAGFPALLAIDRRTAARAAELEPKVALLEALGLFAGARRPILERLAAAARPVAFAAGAPIVREGDPAEALYVLAEGEVQVSARGEAGGEERAIRVMSSPSLFGEIGVLEGIPRTASVTALGPCRCERIDGEQLLEAFTSAPPSASLMENARSRLAITHPSRPLSYASAAGAPAPAHGGTPHGGRATEPGADRSR